MFIFRCLNNGCLRLGKFHNAPIHQESLDETCRRTHSQEFRMAFGCSDRRCHMPNTGESIYDTLAFSRTILVFEFHFAWFWPRPNAF